MVAKRQKTPPAKGAPLGPKELAVMQLVASGTKVADAGRVLKIGADSAHMAMKRIRVKMGVETNEQAISAWPTYTPTRAVVVRRDSWTDEEVAELRRYLNSGMDSRECARMFVGRRTPKGVHSRFFRMSHEPKPSEQDAEFDPNFVHHVSPVGAWRVDHPIKARSVFELAEVA